MSSVSVAAAAPGGPAASAAEGPPVHVLNLHAAFLKALPHAKLGTKVIFHPPGWHAKAATPIVPTSCTEPHCNLSYGGGTVQHSPKVYLLLWGPNWGSGGTITDPAGVYLANLYGGLGVSPQDNWSKVMSQYTDSTGHPTFGTTVFAGAFQDINTPPVQSQSTIAAEADAFASTHGITDTNDAQIVVASQSGTCFSDGFEGNCGVPQNSPYDYCAYHSSSNEPYTNLPYSDDATGTSYTCGQNWINGGSAGTYDGFSIIGGHEYAETVTDPVPFGGWADFADTISDGTSPGEIGDKCAWGELGAPIGDVTLSTGTFAMQSLWSNAGSACRMTPVPPPPPPPSGYVALTKYSPKVLDDAGVTTNGTRPVVWNKSTSPTHQQWIVVNHGTYEVIELKAHPTTCLDIKGNGTANGTVVDLWTCNGGVNQEWRHLASGQLEAVHATAVRGRPIELDADTPIVNGAKLQLYQAISNWAPQLWTQP